MYTNLWDVKVDEICLIEWSFTNKKTRYEELLYVKFWCTKLDSATQPSNIIHMHSKWYNVSWIKNLSGCVLLSIYVTFICNKYECGKCKQWPRLFNWGRSTWIFLILWCNVGENDESTSLCLFSVYHRRNGRVCLRGSRWSSALSKRHVPQGEMSISLI